MIQVRLTSIEELYAVTGAVLKAVTGREWWQASGIQSRPSAPYAVLYFQQGDGLENSISENVQMEVVVDAESFKEVDLGMTLLDCKASFYRSATENTALDAAIRFRNALRQTARFYDMWQIAGFIGAVRLIDVSSIFRADIEPRADVKWQMYANLAVPLPLTGVGISEIETQTIEITHTKQDDIESLVVVEINNPE